MVDATRILYESLLPNYEQAMEKGLQMFGSVGDVTIFIVIFNLKDDETELLVNNLLLHVKILYFHMPSMMKFEPHLLPSLSIFAFYYKYILLIYCKTVTTPKF